MKIPFVSFIMKLVHQVIRLAKFKNTNRKKWVSIIMQTARIIQKTELGIAHDKL